MTQELLKAVEHVVREKARQVAEEAAEDVLWALTRAIRDGKETSVGNPLAMALLGARGDDYLGAAMQSPSLNHLLGPESIWLQPIGNTGVMVEVIHYGDEVLVRPAPSPATSATR
ncbi:MAG: hypothetical protein KatS3mg051_2118 [Anaerolineae bacterium]|nr:MAG: hypothetical protein KatS3mg051_2118 [Anaerolineae bacterium]